MSHPIRLNREYDEEQRAAQLRLAGATVGAAGRGGIRGALAVRLARLGVLNTAPALRGIVAFGEAMLAATMASVRSPRPDQREAGWNAEVAEHA